MSRTPIRLLFLTADRFPPFRPDVEILFANKLVGRGHRIEWLMQATSNATLADASDWPGGRVWIARTDDGTRAWNRVRKHALNLLNDTRVFSLLKEGRFDFVQVKDQFLTSLIALCAARMHGVPFLFWLSFPYPEAALLQAQEPDARYPRFYRVRAWVFGLILYRILGRAADHIFVQSDAMKASLAAKGIDPERMTAVPMGIDPEMFPPRGEIHEVDARTRNPTVVYLGSLGRARRLEFLLDAFEIVVKARPTARLLLIGGGDEPGDQPYLEDYAQRLGLRDKVVFTGFVSREEALARAAEADVGVSPIRSTPIYDVASPTKILEYMALGLPVVANDQPDQKQVLEESGGGICTAYDSTAFGNAIVEILKDRERATQMGARGRRYVLSSRSYDAIADRVEETYVRLLAKSPPKTSR